MTLRINEPTVTYQIFVDEVVIINLVSGDYFSAGHTAAEVWGMVAGGVPASRIPALLAGRWQEPAGLSIASEVAAFLERLQSENLIVEDAAAPVAAGPWSMWEARELKPVFQALSLQKYSDMQELLWLDPVHDVDESGWPNKPASNGASPVE